MVGERLDEAGELLDRVRVADLIEFVDHDDARLVREVQEAAHRVGGGRLVGDLRVEIEPRIPGRQGLPALGVLVREQLGDVRPDRPEGIRGLAVVAERDDADGGVSREIQPELMREAGERGLPHAALAEEDHVLPRLAHGREDAGDFVHPALQELAVAHRPRRVEDAREIDPRARRIRLRQHIVRPLFAHRQVPV